MFTYNFAKDHVAAVESLAKPITIRAMRKDGRAPKPGEHLRLYTGMRTKNCRPIMEAVCQRIQEIRITFDWVAIRGGQENGNSDWIYLNKQVALQLARTDGFTDFESFWRFFAPQAVGGAFHGHLIHFRPMTRQELRKISTTKKPKTKKQKS